MAPKNHGFSVNQVAAFRFCRLWRTPTVHGLDLTGQAQGQRRRYERPVRGVGAVDMVASGNPHASAQFKGISRMQFLFAYRHSRGYWLRARGISNRDVRGAHRVVVPRNGRTYGGIFGLWLGPLWPANGEKNNECTSKGDATTEKQSGSLALHRGSLSFQAIRRLHFALVFAE